MATGAARDERSATARRRAPLRSLPPNAAMQTRIAKAQGSSSLWRSWFALTSIAPAWTGDVTNKEPVMQSTTGPSLTPADWGVLLGGGRGPHSARHPDAPGRARPVADPAGRALGSRQQWLGVHQRQWRLGVSRLPLRALHRPGSVGRRSLRAQRVVAGHARARPVHIALGRALTRLRWNRDRRCEPAGPALREDPERAACRFLDCFAGDAVSR
jgi:hypothetical protein